jgi:hypothetical protein
VSDYPNQQRHNGGWPAQPPLQRNHEHAGRQRMAAGYQAGPSGEGPVQRARPPRRRRGRRAGGVLLVLAIVIAALFVAADRITVSYAQTKIAAKIQDQAGLSARPSVTIEGFPFLTQLAARDIRKVDISARNVAENRVTISSVTATATGVHLSSGFGGATIGQINGTALISYASLRDVLGVPGATIAPDPAAGPNGIAISERPLGAVTGRVTLLSPTQVSVRLNSLGGLAGLLSRVLGTRQSYLLNIPALPVGLRVTSVTVAGQGMVLTAAAHDTTLSQ